MAFGPRLQYSEQIHQEKYRVEGETFENAMARVARGLTDDEKHYNEFQEILLDMRFLPAGRIQSAIGASKIVTAHNCFVGGTIPDSFVTRDNLLNSSIMCRAGEGAETMRWGGGLGNDFSTLRPSGALIKKINSTSSGPIKFMGIFNAIGDATSSTGERRGAQMGILRIDHPDIFSFVKVKQDNHTLNRFNISVAVTDKFFEHLASGQPFPLVFEGEVYRYVDPVELWETLMQSTRDWAEPGVVFIDTINAKNNLYYCEKIAALNPCGEQPLPPHGACLLGSYNFTKYIRFLHGGKCYFDYDQFAHDISIITRAMDNIIDKSNYPLPEQQLEAKNKRRMGIGGTGLANVGEVLGYPYGTPEFLAFEAKLNHLLTRLTYLASSSLAAEKGSFPLFDTDKYLQGEFIKTLDEDVQDSIRINGMRNSHLISWAPTGTISMTADNVSSSLEPVYQWRQQRPVIMPSGTVNMDLYDYGFREWHVRGRRAANGEVTAKQHVDVLVTAQKYTDSAVSKTVNCDGSMPMDEFKNIYLDAYARGAKGCTTFNKDGKRFGLFKSEIESDHVPFPNSTYAIELHREEYVDAYQEGSSCTFDPATGRKTCE